jgi:hypothetical protein
MSSVPAAATTLPNPLPGCVNARIVLFVLRRMGAHGLGDAHAAQALLNVFGESFRRPLLLLRTFMADVAAASLCPISIAPNCCVRMTVAESAILTILARCEAAPETAQFLLADLLGTRRVNGVLASATAVASAFADAGRPISG